MKTTVNSLGDLVGYDDFSYCLLYTNGSVEMSALTELDELRFDDERWNEVSKQYFLKKYNELTQSLRDKLEVKCALR